MPTLRINPLAVASTEADIPVDSTGIQARKKDGKSVRFECRMSPREAAVLDRSARRAGLSKSDYVRSLVDGRTVHLLQLNIDGERFDALLHELKKSGTNVNQIARRLNRGDKVVPEEFSAMLAEHREAARKVSDFIDEIRPGR